jgi:hypothetical protein
VLDGFPMLGDSLGDLDGDVTVMNSTGTHRNEKEQVKSFLCTGYYYCIDVI